MKNDETRDIVLNTTAYDSLHGLAEASWDFVVATFVLTALTIVILHALKDVYLRSHLHRRWLYVWCVSNNKNVEVLRKDMPDIFDLTFVQFCAQIGAILNSKLDSILSFKLDKKIEENVEMEVLTAFIGVGAKSDLMALYGYYNNKDTELELVRRRIAFQIERSLDLFQAYLVRKWHMTNYLLSISIAVIFGILLAFTNNAFKLDEGWILTSSVVVVTAGIAAPGLSDFITWLRAPR